MEHNTWGRDLPWLVENPSFNLYLADNWDNTISFEICTGSQHQRIRRSNGGTRVVYLYTNPQVKTFQGHLLQVPDVIDEFWPAGITHKYAENCKTWLWRMIAVLFPCFLIFGRGVVMSKIVITNVFVIFKLWQCQILKRMIIKDVEFVLLYNFLLI